LGELDITYEIAQQIYDALKGYFGENGLVDALYSEMQRMIIENLNQTSQQVNTWATGVIEQIRKLFSQLSETSNQFSTPVPPQLIPPGSTSPFSSNLPGYQEGGTLVATKPTVAVFGEIPEIVTFTPINRRGANEGKVFGGNLPGNLGPQQKILLDILLSPDLEVRMKDQISNELADVVVEVTKYRR